MLHKFLVTILFVSTLVFAQGRGGGAMGGGGGDDMGGGSGVGRGNNMGGEGGMAIPRTTTRMDQISEALKLNKEQKKEVKTILDEAQKEAAPIHEQLLKSELAIGDAIQGGKAGDDLKGMINSEAALQTQMAGIELGAFAKIYKLLDKEQTAQTRTLFPMMKGLFSGKNWNIPE
ncbi:MAG TPA: Spy/CpxP family protein refolding chaperone [Bryobacteraceae bacterium]|nr:Spy/CpxP family protein refolding chaperone [Bryobacteraceae bacterium]